jgi:hypothetical protein
VSIRVFLMTRRDDRDAIIPRLLPIVAAVFTLLVFSQDAGLSDELYRPISVKLVGLNERNSTGRKSCSSAFAGTAADLLRQGDEWRSSVRADTTVLRVEVPEPSNLLGH